MIVTQDEIKDRLLRTKFLREIKPQPQVGLSAMSSLTKGGEGAVRQGWFSIAYLYRDHEGELEVPIFNIRLQDGEYDLVNALLKGACNDLAYSFIDLSESAREKKGGLQQTQH